MGLLFCLLIKHLYQGLRKWAGGNGLFLGPTPPRTLWIQKSLPLNPGWEEAGALGNPAPGPALSPFPQQWEGGGVPSSPARAGSLTCKWAWDRDQVCLERAWAQAGRLQRERWWRLLELLAPGTLIYSFIYLCSAGDGIQGLAYARKMLCH
jgi:hypothetical protein